MQQHSNDDAALAELSTKCRVCLINNERLVDIFGSDGKCGKIWVAVMECGSVQVAPGDRLPASICVQCLEKLRNAHEFRTLCMLSDQTLRQYIDFLQQQQQRQRHVVVQNVEYRADGDCASNDYASIVSRNEGALLDLPSSLVVDPATTHVDASTRTNPYCEQQRVEYSVPTSQAGKRAERTTTERERRGRRAAGAAAPIASERRAGRSYEPNLTGKFSCRVCSKRFDTDRQLTRHEGVSHGERRHACATCGKRFTERGVLKAHVAALHAPPSSGRPFRCPFCDKAYVARAHLRVHVCAAHTRERPHACPTCGKSFAQRSVLRDHAASHAGHRPHACASCGARFVRAAHLRRHVDVIHADDARRARPPKLDRAPQPSERPHACTTCAKRFVRREHLARHMAVHDGERAHACGLCDKRFARKWDVKRHMATHRDGRVVVLVPPTVAQAALRQLGAA